MMTDEDLQLAKKNHVVLVGTDFTESAARENGFPELHAVFVDRLKRAYQIGVTMAFGTDVFVYVPEKRAARWRPNMSIPGSKRECPRKIRCGR